MEVAKLLAERDAKHMTPQECAAYYEENASSFCDDAPK